MGFPTTPQCGDANLMVHKGEVNGIIVDYQIMGKRVFSLQKHLQEILEAPYLMNLVKLLLSSIMSYLTKTLHTQGKTTLLCRGTD